MLVKTYSNEGETVLDNTIGSGTTAIACINTNRNCIGIEKHIDIYNIAKKRVEEKKEEKDNEPPTLFNAQT
jgi:site-specific DNA-methyltransferase (adenine-specific)